MTDGLRRTFDPQGEARRVLQGAVADFGQKVLSNATIVEGICEDRLPQSPREASLIASAARFDVPGMLQQQVGGVGPDAAVRLTAATLADSRSLDPAACVWVVSEFARCLGYQVSDDIEPSAFSGQALVVPPAPMEPPPPMAPPAPMEPPPPMAPPAPMPAAPALMPAAPAAPLDATVPPAAVPAFPGPGGPAPLPVPDMTAPAGPYPPEPSPFPASPGMPGPYGPTPSPFPPGGGAAGGRKGPGSPLKALAIGAAMVVLYFVVAGVGHLPPFGTPTPTPTPTPKPSPHHSPFTPTQADLTLSGLVPSSFKSGGHCVYKGSPGFGAAAEIGCANVPGIPAGFMNYYLFNDSTGLDDAYSEDLSRFAQTTEGSGDCGSFATFAPTCETIYGPGHTSEGHLVEYMFQNEPDMTFTVDKHLLMIDMQGGNGDSLLNWWKVIPSPWLASGS